jgi:hypothetical protein
MTSSPHSELDLTVARVIAAPRAAVWNAWTDAASSFMTAVIAELVESRAS